MRKRMLPLRLQFFAENPDEGNEGNNDQSGNAGNGTDQVNFDYDKLQSMLETAAAKKETAVLKSYFQQQGLSEDEARQAMNDFKTRKQEQQQQQKQDSENLKEQYAQAAKDLDNVRIELEATRLAGSLGIDAKTLPYVLKMADLSEAKDDKGNLSQENIKAALNKVLEDVPGLKQTQSQSQGFQIGGDGNKGEHSTDNNDIRKMFGLKPKN